MSHAVALAALLVLSVLVENPLITTPMASAETARAAPTAGTDKVNINTADAKTLMSLSGVNRSLADKIVKYRDEHGAFKKAEDLRRVEGVGNGVWEKNRARISVK
jgi:competence ComEA-like helix-hairpin-helix protein